MLNRPDVIQGVHESMVEAGAEVVETDTFQASRLKLEEWGLGRAHARDQPPAPRRSRARRSARTASSPARSARPASSPPPRTRRSARSASASSSRSSREQSQGLLEGGVDLLIVETAQDILEVKAAIFGMREAFKQAGRSVPIQASVSLLPNGGKMLLGTDICAALATLEALKVDVIGLNCSTGPEDMRDAIRFLGEYSPLPVHCIPNAGIPHQGPDGETIFPEQPGAAGRGAGRVRRALRRRASSAAAAARRPTTSARSRSAAAPHADRAPAPRRARRTCRSMIAAAPLVQEPAPTIVGERVNSQGSRKAKELLLADDYDGLLQVAEDQVEGGAHVLDLCVALTERQDEDEQMRLVAKKVSLTQPAPIQVDSTEPEVIETALDQIPGRAIVNSVNLEAGERQARPRRPDRDGARRRADRADDRRGRHGQDPRAQARGRQRIHDLVCDEHGMDPELLIFDALTFTLTTGDEEWKPSAVETIEGIRLIKAELPGVKTSLGVSNVSFGIGLPARARPELRLPAPLRRGRARPRDGQPEPHHALRRDRRGGARARRRPRLQPPRGRAGALHRSTSRPRARRPRPRRPTRPRAWSPRRRCTGTSCAARRTAWRRRSTRCVEKIGAVPTLNDVLLPAMKEVGDKFGAGELILPFVLQSAEVMKRAVAQLEQYLDKLEGYTKGTVVLATVFGDVHDIGKSLVNTILTNNGYTVVDLGKQVPISTILDAAKEHNATAIGLSARCSSRPPSRCRCASRSCTRRASSSRCCSAAPRSTASSRCARSTRTARSPTSSTTRASSTARTPSRAWP